MKKANCSLNSIEKDTLKGILKGTLKGTLKQVTGFVFNVIWTTLVLSGFRA